MGTLYIVSTPIGNLEDITIRALKTLFSVDIIAGEDTRRTGQLLTLLQEKYGAIFSLGEKKPRIISYYDQIEEKTAPEIIHFLEEGKSVALVTDAGTPLVSDPGYRLIEQTIKRNIPVLVIPGVSAFLTALTGSGMPVNMFMFLGYFSDKDAKRKSMLEALKQVGFPTTYSCYVAPHKLVQTLEDMKEIYGDIPLVIGRELTKIHEEYFRGSVSEALIHFENPKGEFVLLFSLSK